jgi:hypothetical protein
LVAKLNFLTLNFLKVIAILMTAQTTSVDTLVLRRQVLGSRRFSNYWWASIVSIGATGFFLAAISSYTKVNLLPFADPTQLVFIPQGIAMGFYGAAGILLALYLWLSIAWDLGGGYKKFVIGFYLLSQSLFLRSQDAMLKNEHLLPPPLLLQPVLRHLARLSALLNLCCLVWTEKQRLC